MESLTEFPMYINGKWCESHSGKWIESVNPFTTKSWARVPQGQVADVEYAVQSAKQAFVTWSQTNASTRAKILRRLGDLVAEHADELAHLESQDNGKLLTEMSMQLKYIPEWCYYYAGMADKIEGSVLPADKPNVLNFTRYEPLGVIACITPWNSPLMITAWKCAPALAAGNTVVIKPSEFSSVSALKLATLIEQAGFPPGVVNIVTGYGHEIGEALVKHHDVAKVSFTGGVATGQRIYQSCADQLIPVCLELGGKSPNIVFEDAHINHAINGAMAGIFAASGQTCIAGSRLLLHDAIYDEFVEELLNKTRQIQMGDPLDPHTQIGPICTEAQYEKILSYIQIAKDEGAHCALGGCAAARPECGDGWFVEPTIFTEVDNSMRIAQEEVFGPVLSIIRFHDEDEALSLANDTPFGLAAGVWTENMARAIRCTEQLHAGTVWVNTYRMFSYLSPFGGYKQSGLGREGGFAGLHEFLQSKSVWINLAEEVPNPFVMR